MDDPLEEMTNDCFLCDGLTIFGSTLKDRFVSAVKDNYWDLHGLSYPIASIDGYKNQTRRLKKNCEYCKEPRMLIWTRYNLWPAKTVNKTLRKSHCSYWTSYALGISLLVLRPNMQYTPKHEDYLSFRPRQSNRTGYLSKTIGFSSSGISIKTIYKRFIKINEQHGHHSYFHHCSIVWNFNHNSKKQNHRWYDESTRGAETPHWWNIGINVRYIQGLCSLWKKYGKIIFTRIQQRRLIYLMNWVKDRTCLE